MNEYFTEFYNTQIDNPYTCDIDYIVYHGIVYTYRKSWIKKRIKRRILFHTSSSYRDFCNSKQIESIQKKVQSEVEKVLEILKK